MSLKKNYNVFNIFKISKNIFYLYGVFGSQFLKLPQTFILNKKYKVNIFDFLNETNIFFRKVISLKYGWRLRLKIVGRGLSFFKRNNYVYMNIGRSHIVRYFTPNILRIFCLKKSMSIISNNLDYIMKISLMLTTVQPYLIYKTKGLIYDNFTYKTKPGKIKQYRV